MEQRFFVTETKKGMLESGGLPGKSDVTDEGLKRGA